MPSLSSLGLPDIRGRMPLLAGLAIDSFGTGCTAPLFLLFFTRVAHVPLGKAGLVISLAAAFSIIIPALVAQVIERLGPRNLVIAAQFAQGAAFAGLLAARSVPLLFICALINTAGQRVFWSSIFSLIADISTERDRDRWFGLAGMMQASGFGLGSLVAGVLLAIGGTAPFLVAMGINAGSFLIAGWLLSRLRVTHRRAAQDSSRVRIGRDRPFVALIAVNTAFALCSMLLGVGLPVFVTEGLPAAPSWLVGVLLALISVGLATGQTLVVRLTESRHRGRVLVVAAGLWVGWGLIMGGLRHIPSVLVVPGLILAILPFAVADLLHASTNNALAAAAAPAHSRGRYLSYYQYSFTLAGVIAPAFFAQLYSAGADYPWLAAAILAAASGIGVAALGRFLPATALRREPEARIGALGNDVCAGECPTATQTNDL